LDRFKFIADVGGGSVTFYNFDGNTFTEYKNIKMFLNKKNNESPNQLYKLDPTGQLFAQKFKDSLLLYPEITTENLLILQTGKMREDNVLCGEHNQVNHPNFPYLHYYLDNEHELAGEAMDLCMSVTEGKEVKSISFFRSINENIVNIIINEPNIFDYIKKYIMYWYTYLIN
jgi:hypothetical protein